MRARNRWCVAYTLVRNPALQKYTANNIQLLQLSAEENKKKVFSLEHTIRSLSQDHGKRNPLFEPGTKKKAELVDDMDIDIGEEITSCEDLKEYGEELGQGVKMPMWEGGGRDGVRGEGWREGVDGGEEGEMSNVPYQKWT